MNSFKLGALGLLIMMAISGLADPLQWFLVDDFQQLEAGQVFTDATEIGWHEASPDGNTEFSVLEDPQDPANVGMFIQSINNHTVYGNIWCQKALPEGGILPGETGTLFFRCHYVGPMNAWAIGTADKDLAYDSVTGEQTVPGAWGDFNALIRLGLEHQLEHRDGSGYVSTDPKEVLSLNTWYSFWMVVENSWDSSVTPAATKGVFTLYVQGPGIGDGLSPTLIPVGTDPPKDKAKLRHPPIDEEGNPQSIKWLQFSTNPANPEGSNAERIFLLDDLYFSPGENLTDPLVNDDPNLPEAPSNLNATILPDSRIELTWEDNASVETGFKVLMKTGYQSDWVERTDIPEADVTHAMLYNVDPQIPHRIIVQAYNAEGNYRSSLVAEATWGNPVLSDATLNRWDWWEMDWFGEYWEFNKDWIFHRELGVFFLNGEDAAGFHLYSPDMECWFWTSEDLFPLLYKYGPYDGWYYYYRGAVANVRWFARLEDGTFVRSTHINEAVEQSAAPSALKAYISSPSQVRLTWMDNALYEVGYRIFMQAGEEGEWTEVASVQQENLKYYILNDVDTSQELRFKVQTYKYGSESLFSNIALAEVASSFGQWIIIDDFQRFSDLEIFTDAAEIGWHASCPEQTDEYWMLADPHDPDNIAMFVESSSYSIGYGNVFCQKELPGGGIAPGETGTLFFRCLWAGIDNNWHVGTADRDLAYDDVTGLQTVPGAWGDFNALIRLGVAQNLEHRDGGGYVATDPEQVVIVNIWYSFWMVVENSWDMSTSPPTSTGVFTLYVQGAGFGDGISPTLIPVGTDPPKDQAALRRAPVDEHGNPQSIIWLQFATNSGFPTSGAGDPFILDDFYFSKGDNLSSPVD